MGEVALAQAYVYNIYTYTHTLANFSCSYSNLSLIAWKPGRPRARGKILLRYGVFPHLLLELLLSEVQRRHDAARVREVIRESSVARVIFTRVVLVIPTMMSPRRLCLRAAAGRRSAPSLFTLCVEHTYYYRIVCVPLARARAPRYQGNRHRVHTASMKVHTTHICGRILYIQV